VFNVGGSEMVLLGILALLVFGPEKLPGIIKSVMRTVRALQTAARDFQSEVRTALEIENERQDLAKRQREPDPDQESSKPALDTPVPPEPESEETAENAADLSSDEAPKTDGPEIDVDAPDTNSDLDDRSEGQDETAEPLAESQPMDESESLDEPEDDDGPRLPMTAKKEPANP
jgi:Tat protein translocase TatB subunit